MPKLPVVSGKDLIKYLGKKGFFVTRIKGSHHVLKSADRIVVVPLHEELDTGTLSGILQDAGIDRDDFIREWHS